MKRVLLVDDDALVREALAQTLELAGYRPTVAASYIEAKDHITPGFDGVVLSDIRMPGKDGFALLEYAQQQDEELPVILLTGEADIPMAVRGIAAGAFDFLEKPCAPKDLLAVVEKASNTRALVLENRHLRRQVEAGDAAVRLLRGTSPQAEAVRAQARAVARTSADVLVTGEAGAGTSKLAEVVHLLSVSSSKPFVKMPAAAQTPDTLPEAFGQAEGGTLFLDEIGALSAAAQFTLLELIDSAAAPRVVAGTYLDLAQAVAEGRFHPDLYYRLEATRIRIPPLRERREDVPVLFRHYVSLACEQAGLPEPEISSDTEARLLAQDWPGNARSLMNSAMRFAMGLEASEPEAELGLAEQLAQVERALLISALQRRGGNASDAARDLKLPRKTFYDKLTRHGIRAERYRH